MANFTTSPQKKKKEYKCVSCNYNEISLSKQALFKKIMEPSTVV